MRRERSLSRPHRSHKRPPLRRTQVGTLTMRQRSYVARTPQQLWARVLLRRDELRQTLSQLDAMGLSSERRREAIAGALQVLELIFDEQSGVDQLSEHRSKLLAEWLTCTRFFREPDDLSPRPHWL
jgi:hypothetical protein